MGSVQTYRDNDISPFILSGRAFWDYKVLKQIVGRAVNMAQFTVLGKQIIDVGVVVPNVANTGDGTVTGFALNAGDGRAYPLIGDYVLECTAAVANGGVFKLTDPNGVIIAEGLTLTAGAGVATTFRVQGMVFIVTDGAADFIVGDNFTLPIVPVSKYGPLDPAAFNGLERFAGILLSDAIAFADIAAGDVTGIHVLMSEADIDKNKLVFEDSAVAGAVTLATVLPSGKTVEEEMTDVEIMALDRENISGVPVV